MAMRTRILLGLGMAFLVVQLIRPSKNDRAPAFAGGDDITAFHPTSAEVRRILATACYDCHSNHTEYPWYAEIQPVGWWLASHVRDGKAELNFSEFARYTTKRKMKKLEELCDEVRDRAMPLKSYRWLHRGARLSDSEINALCEWSEQVQEQVVAK